MLTIEARRILGIPLNVGLPPSLGELYDHWFAGRSYKTSSGLGWTFNPRREDQRNGYDLCLEQHTAQFWFGLDHAFRVYVQCEAWIPMASSFVSLVEGDAILEVSQAKIKRMRSLGKFPSQDEFAAKHADQLHAFQDISPDPEFSRIFQGPESLIVSSRFYSKTPVFNVTEYLF
jgi:hypothetical protein